MQKQYKKPKKEKDNNDKSYLYCEGYGKSYDNRTKVKILSLWEKIRKEINYVD